MQEEQDEQHDTDAARHGRARAGWAPTSSAASCATGTAASSTTSTPTPWPRWRPRGPSGAHTPGGLRGQAREAARGLDHGAGRRSPTRPSTSWPGPRSRATSSSTAATPTTATTSPARQRCAHHGHPLRRLRHQRRRLGPRARLLPDDRRRGPRSSARLDPIFQTIAPGSGDAEPTPGRTGTRRHRRARATCTAAPTARATSSRWSTTASSTG